MNDSVALSIVIPAYNEENRLPRMVARTINYCESRFGADFEIIVVDDGSNDRTAPCLEPLLDQCPRLELISHSTNRGKGAAVKTGVLHSSGSLVLFSDADGATPIEDEIRLREAISNGAEIAIGSRVLPCSDVTRVRRWDRRLIGRLFRQLVRFYVELPVRDSQCGFKMFRREAARVLFSMCEEDGYAFDIFLLQLAVRLGLRIDEVAVNWRDVNESKVNLIGDSMRMWHDVMSVDARVDRSLLNHNTTNAASCRHGREKGP